MEPTGADAYVSDRDYRRRDPAIANASRCKEHDKKERAFPARMPTVSAGVLEIGDVPVFNLQVSFNSLVSGTVMGIKTNSSYTNRHMYEEAWRKLKQVEVQNNPLTISTSMRTEQ